MIGLSGDPRGIVKTHRFWEGHLLVNVRSGFELPDDLKFFAEGLILY